MDKIKCIKCIHYRRNYFRIRLEKVSSGKCACRKTAGGTFCEFEEGGEKDNGIRKAAISDALSYLATVIGDMVFILDESTEF